MLYTAGRFVISLIIRKTVIPLRMYVLKVALVAICQLFLVACATNPSNNKPLTLKSQSDYDFGKWIDESGKFNKDNDRREILIALSFSGGGLRAATLAASVVDTLKNLGLYDRVAIISSTSGGSVTAGFVAAKGVDKFPELKKNFLRWDNTSELMPGVISSFLTGANRSQKFADYLDTRLFNGLDKPITYDDLRLRWQNAPYVILNATDASYGHTFEFNQNTFSTLCSDLGSFRISEAIAASAAFPFLMSPVTLRNNWDKCKYLEDKNPFNSNGYNKAVEQQYIELGNFVSWRHTHSLRFTYDQDEKNKPYRRVKFVHLLDGGLSDNLAARALLRTFGENESESIKKLIKMGVRRILFIQVNAKSDSPNDIDMSGNIPSLFNVFKSASMNPIDVTTALSSYISREYMVSLVNYFNVKEISEPEGQIYFYPVQVDFDLLESGSPDQIEAKSIHTWWTLPSSNIDLLEKVGKNLLVKHPCFQAFAEDSGIKNTPVNLANNCRDFIKLQVADAQIPMPPKPAPAERFCYKPAVVDILFTSNNATINTAYDAYLTELGNFLKDFPNAKGEIFGHTDSVGSAANKLKLSIKRAAMVKDYIVKKFGINADRLTTIGYGDTRPVASNKTEAGKAKNRRVEIYLTCE